MSKAIKNIFPLGFPWQTPDPFLFCVYHQDNYPAGTETLGPAPSYLKGRPIGNDFQKKDGFRMYHGTEVPGFPGHPHRGFETITIVEQGYADHSDSMGATGRFGNGDVQWMTAGKGVMHSEMFPLISSEGPNILELFQIWLNLPRKSKMVEPHYKMLWNEDIPVHKTDGVEVKVVAGDFKDSSALNPTPDSWAADPVSEVGVWLISIPENGKVNLPSCSADCNRSIYLYEGEKLSVQGVELTVNHGAELLSGAVNLENKSSSAKVLVLQGRPIGEPVVQHGPFVMNTEGEIRAAIMDYQKDQFGGWPWPKYEHVHPRDAGRFAKYADGAVEKRGD
ncbi:pirin family protein [Luteibaculum oceani]|uniref:Pirin family protein n=1 Tax=Luteibaculum oceani TaxID=1294296 RepID=A0A5C6V138_9FLAO|nr:pirin family protein [Luteibaculum oceani]TXC78341.1 pirin family protein [Luteibaculum oceani]